MNGAVKFFDLFDSTDQAKILNGEGVGATGQLLTAILACIDNGSRRVDFGFGNFYLEERIPYGGDGVWLSGLSPVPGYSTLSGNQPFRMGTALIWSTSSPIDAGLDALDENGNGYWNCGLENVWMYNAAASRSNGPARGVRASRNFIVRGTTIERMYGDAVCFANLTNSARVENSTLVDNGNGFAIYGADSTVATVSATRLRSNDVGAYLEGGDGVMFDQRCVIEGNRRHAVSIYKKSGYNNLKNIDFVGTHFEANGYDGSTYRYPIITRSEVAGETIKALTLRGCVLDNLAYASKKLCDFDDIDSVHFDRTLFASNNGGDSFVTGSRAQRITADNCIGASDGLDFSTFPHGLTPAQLGCKNNYGWTASSDTVSLHENKPSVYTRSGEGVLTCSFDITWPTTTNTASAIIAGLPGDASFGAGFASYVEFPTPVTLQVVGSISGPKIYITPVGGGSIKNNQMSGLRLIATVVLTP